ncbi:MAG: PD40 domain-containing protein [Chloroflexi bacterium]|nr:PD40 domain-containing protein [Chloroflexota bacterium]
MLLRAYRLTDRLGLVLLKTSAALAHYTLNGASSAVNLAGAGAGGVLGTLWGVVSTLGGGIWRLLRWLLRNLWNVLVAIGGVIFGVLALISRLFLRATGQAARTVATSAGAVNANAMARRAARSEAQAEIDTVVVEDPLRRQNRALSGLTAALLFVLIGVVLWATNPTRGVGSVPEVVSLNSADTNLLNDTPQPTAGALPTTIPTATPLPEVLEVRGSLAYVVRDRGQTDIWAVNVGTRTPLRLTNSSADDRDPAWSPDGRRLAFASRRDGNWDIYIYDLNTGETTRVTYGLEFQGKPTWSPDGLWLAYESYQGSNLDIYALPIDFSQPPVRLTDSPAPDFAPAWSPDGRRIAFVSWRDGNQDVYVYDFDTPGNPPVNITNTPTRYEDVPAWNPDGETLAYSALDEGLYKVFVQPVDPGVPAQVQPNSGRMPAWSPDGGSLVFVSDSIEGTQLIASPFALGGSATLIVPVPFGATTPVWTGTPLPAALVNQGGVSAPALDDLYIEQEARNTQNLYNLGPLPGVDAPVPYLSDRVNDSFNALREAAARHIGYDFLGRLEDALWSLIPQQRLPQPGEEIRNWHYTGRAFAFNRRLPLGGFPAPVEIVREDIGIYTYWRIYVRVTDDAQSGELGEPLRHMPWDFASRAQGDVQAYDEGGRLRVTMPEGYYIDLTQLAADYGWERIPAGADWRANINAANYWIFVKNDDMDWYHAMLELYSESQLGGFVPTATPLPTPIITPTQGGG